MKSKSLFIIFLIIIILWMAMVFYMSAQPATESAELSGGLGKWLADILVPDHSSWSSVEWNDYVELIDHLIRKAAHFTEYTILGVFLCVELFLASQKKQSRSVISQHTSGDEQKIAEEGTSSNAFRAGKLANLKTRLVYAWIIGTAYAVTDEFHQLFVEGRSGEVFDVLLDSSGVLTGSLIVTLICFLWQRRLKNHEAGCELTGSNADDSELGGG